MWITKIVSISVLCYLLIGCTDNEESTQNNLDDAAQPINYETKKEQSDRLGVRKKNTGEQGGYPQSEQTEMNNGDERGKKDLFTNEESISISNHLKEWREVIQAQVALTEDRVVVGVTLNPSAPPNMQDIIKKEVQKIKPDKKVFVYTDDIYWDRMRNKDARLDQANSDMDEFLDEFFNRTRD